MTTTRHVKSLYDVLLERGRIAPERLHAAQEQAEQSGQPLRRILVQHGLMSEEEVVELVAEQSGLATIDLSTYLVKPDVIQLIPEALARRHLFLPLFKIAETLTIAIADPMQFFILDAVRLQTKCDVKAVLASETSIRRALDQYYGSASLVQEVSQAIKAAAQPRTEEAIANEGPVIRLVELLVTQAVKEHASDIHLEPGDGALRTRFRIDGVLHQVHGPPKVLHAAVVSRIKVLSDLDIAEKRRAQDGRFRLPLDDGAIDVRVSTIPTPFGEKVVLRLLGRAEGTRDLSQVGLATDVLAQCQQLIRSPHGIFLVTGPTGSGKTTTLYAALQMSNDLQKNIVTIEDPIECQLPGVTQVQYNPKTDMTFASALRAFLRQDPDIIMVGEIRDRDTAQIAVQAALTGHLVFSTLHTNDAPTALARLIDMDIDAFLVASSVIGILAQRLVRVICPKCKESYQWTAPALSELPFPKETPLFRGRGCPACKHSGYKRRLGIFELLPVTQSIKDLVTAKAPAHEIREAARQAGMRTLREDGFAKVLAGLTTLEEVLRVTQLEEAAGRDPAHG